MKKLRLKSPIQFIITAAGIAAAYTVCTMLTASFSFGVMQLRIAEAMTVLPFFSSAAVVGLTVGCAISNALFSPIALDIIVGTAATLIASLITRFIRIKWLAPLPPVIVNAVFIGWLLTYYATGDFSLNVFLLNAGIIAAEQSAVCYGLGLPLLLVLERTLYKSSSR